MTKPPFTLVLRSKDKLASSTSGADFYCSLPTFPELSEPFYLQLTGLMLDTDTVADQYIIQVYCDLGVQHGYDTSNAGPSQLIGLTDSSFSVQSTPRIYCGGVTSLHNVHCYLKTSDNESPDYISEDGVIIILTIEPA